MIKNLPTILLLYLLFILTGALKAQNVPEHISDENIYLFLDELATQGVIELNSAVKPYSRLLIAKKLTEAAKSDSLLSYAQIKEVKLLLKDYALETGKEHRAVFNFTKPGQSTQISILPPVFNYRDSLFRVSIKPIYGINYITNQNGNVRHTWGGVSANAYIGKNWSIWASLRDNYQTNEVLAIPGYLTTDEGGNYKINVQGRRGGDYSEMRAGIAWSWKWGSFSFSKDHQLWGDNYHGSNIFSGRTPSYAMIKLQLDPAKWFSFTYTHGWLVSEVIDSSRSYYSQPGNYRAVFRDKYLAANMFTFKPFKGLFVSAGNSIIYSDTKVQPAYLIPFMFFKSVDHTLSHNIDNQNSQMFLNISSRQIKYIHLFASVFIDEFSISRVGDPEKSNFTSYKAGFSLAGWPVKNLTLRAEGTRSNPITYKHRVETLTFETNHFNLGHYLRDNAREWYVALSWRPIAGLYANLSWFMAEHGNEYSYDLAGSVPVDEYPFMEDVTWRNNTLAIDVRYMLWNNLSVFAGFSKSDIQGFDVDGKTGKEYLNQFTPAIFHGKNNTLNIGFQMGF
jgi:hypothetical protein